MSGRFRNKRRITFVSIFSGLEVLVLVVVVVSFLGGSVYFG